MITETRKLADLVGWDKNPRSIKPEALERLKNLITKLGVFKPFLITKDGLVLGGNMRLLACQQLGIEEVPVSIVKADDDATRLQYALADNDRAGFYDKKQLKDLLSENPEIELEEFAVDLGPLTPLTELMKGTEVEKPEVNFTEELMEEHNYVVLYFENEVDWLQLQSLYPLKTVKALDSKPGFTKMGVGRVVRGVDFLNTLLQK